MTAHKYITREALETWYVERCAKIVDLERQLNRTEIQLLDMESERNALRSKYDALLTWYEALEDKYEALRAKYALNT